MAEPATVRMKWVYATRLFPTALCQCTPRICACEHNASDRPNAKAVHTNCRAPKAGLGYIEFRPSVVLSTSTQVHKCLPIHATRSRVRPGTLHPSERGLCTARVCTVPSSLQNHGVLARWYTCFPLKIRRNEPSSSFCSVLDAEITLLKFLQCPRCQRQCHTC